jgi:hypothetical protein
LAISEGETMNVERIRVDRKKARDLYRKYKEHQHYSTPIDREIQRTYQLIAQGRVVIKALESIRLAGLGEDKLPRLAICRADHRKVELRMGADGGATFECPGRHRGTRGQRISLPGGTFTRRDWVQSEALVPLIPVHLRPKRGLENYHILWEAIWSKAPPYDPYLLRRVGGDLWLVVAAWNLTEVERAVMATRVSG